MHHLSPSLSPAQQAKFSLGTPLHSFGRQSQGILFFWKECLGSLIVLSFGGWIIYQSVSSILYLGWDSYFTLRWQNLLWLGIWVFAMWGTFSHLRSVLGTHAEIFKTGFYLKFRSQEYCYAFGEIEHLKIALISGNNNTITSVILGFTLRSGQEVSIQDSGHEVILQFMQVLSLAYTDAKKEALLQQFSKGERIGFGSVEIDIHALYFKGEVYPWADISQVTKARADRYLLIMDHHAKKLAKIDQNTLLDEGLFLACLESKQLYTEKK